MKDESVQALTENYDFNNSDASLLKRLLSCIRERRLPYRIYRLLGNTVECGIYFDAAPCNLRCSMCPNGGISDLSNNSIGMMEYDLFKKIIDKFITEKVWVNTVSFGNWGEPLLNRKLPDMIGYLRSTFIQAQGRAPWVTINTNLNFLPDPIGLIESGVNSICISASGMTQETYQKNHIGGKIDSVIDNILRLERAKKQKMIATPRLSMKWHDYIYNKNEQEEAKKFCLENSIKFCLNRVYIHSVEDNMKYQENKDRLAGFYSRFINIDEEASLMTTLSDKNMKDCKLKKRVAINTDGQLYPCCAVYEGKNFMGSIFDNKIKKILKMKPKICEQCAKTLISWHSEFC